MFIANFIENFQSLPLSFSLPKTDHHHLNVACTRSLKSGRFKTEMKSTTKVQKRNAQLQVTCIAMHTVSASDSSETIENSENRIVYYLPWRVLWSVHNAYVCTKLTCVCPTTIEKLQNLCVSFVLSLNDARVYNSQAFHFTFHPVAGFFLHFHSIVVKLLVVYSCSN